MEGLIQLSTNNELIKNKLRERLSAVREQLRGNLLAINREDITRQALLNDKMLNEYDALALEKAKTMADKQLPDKIKKNIITEINKKMSEKEISISMLSSTQTMERATNNMVFLTWVLVFVGLVQCVILGYSIYLQHKQRI